MNNLMKMETQKRLENVKKMLSDLALLSDGISVSVFEKFVCHDVNLSTFFV